MARVTRPEPIDLQTAEVVLAGSEDLLPMLREASLHAGVDASRMHFVSPGQDMDDVRSPRASLAVIVIRRSGEDPAFHRAHAAAERLRPLMAPGAVQVVITVAGFTKLAPKLERVLTNEVLHQLGAAAAPFGHVRPFRNTRMRLGLAGLRTAGVRVFRITIGG